MPYAERTSVSPEKSRVEIEQVLKRYGAETFAYASEPNRAIVMFHIGQHAIRFVIRMLPASEFARFKTSDGYWRTRTEKQRDDAWAQEYRRRWRALYLVIKAKLEAVESGIETLEEAFLAQMVLPSGQTVGEWATPQLEAMPQKGLSSFLALPPGDSDAEVIDIEEVRG